MSPTNGNHRRRTRDHLDHVALNLKVRGLRPSATLFINELCNDLIRKGRTIYKLGLGQSPFPVPQCVVEALKANAHQKDYLDVKGLRALREAVAAFHHRNDGVNVDPGRIIVGPGSKELMFLLQVVFYGDLVVPTPGWVSYAPQAQITGHEVSWLHTCFDEHWRVSPERLEKLCERDPGRPRIVVLNYPSNPHGLTYTRSELKSIAKVARRYDLILLSDEIYGKLHHKGRHASVARYYPERTIVSSGLSKWCGAGGWRLGTFAFPEGLDWLLGAMAAVASETFTSTSAPIQYAAIRAFQGGQEIETYLAHSRRILATLGHWCASRLREAGIRIHEPEGAFYLFPDFTPLTERLASRGITSSVDLAHRLLDEVGVALLPGTDFGRPETELTARLAYVNFDGAAALTGSMSHPLSRPLDDDFVQVHCFRTTQAIDRICDWLSDD